MSLRVNIHMHSLYAFCYRTYTYIQMGCDSVFVKLHPITFYRTVFLVSARFLGWTPLFVFFGLPIVSCSLINSLILNYMPTIRLIYKIFLKIIYVGMLPFPKDNVKFLEHFDLHYNTPLTSCVIFTCSRCFQSPLSLSQYKPLIYLYIYIYIRRYSTKSPRYYR